MWPQPFVPQTPQNEINRLDEDNTTLQMQINHLNSQISTLRGQVNDLQVENARLRALLPPLPPLLPSPPPASNSVYTPPSDNVLHLPVIIESLAVMLNHFQRQGTRKQCSQLRCNQYAFEQACLRAGHMGWCRTHNRIVTGDWTSCSVKAEDRGDCVPIWWEQRDDWADIVNRAYREGRIGCKGLRPAELDMLLFSPTRRLRQVGAPHGAYLHANW